MNSVDPRWKLLVVGHDHPGFLGVDERIEFLKAEFPAPSLASMAYPDAERIFSWHTDKGRKLLLGISRIRGSGCRYFMALDADDLISNQLVGFCLRNANPNGYYIHFGYRMSTGGRWLYRRRNFYHECGSSFILDTFKAPFPDELDFALDFNDYYIRRYVNHAYIPSCMASLDAPLQSIPFHGAIYRFHDQNIYATSVRGPSSKIRDVMRQLCKGVSVSDELISEFSIPQLLS